MLAAVLLVPIAAMATPAMGEDNSLSTPRISVLTFDPGADLFAAFGHIALVVQRGETRTKVYNFGNYDFVRSDSMWRYARGYLDYWVSVSTLESTLKHYRHFDRGAVLRDLALSAQQAQDVSDALDRATLPQNRHYRYHHTTYNCCTRVRDLVNQALDGALAAQFSPVPATRTYRGWLRKLLADRPLWFAFLDFSLGPSVDRPISRYEEQFLPLVLSADLDRALSRDGAPLVRDKQQLLPAHPVPLVTTWQAWLLPGAAAMAFLLGAALGLGGQRPWVRRCLGLYLVAFGAGNGLVGAGLVFLQLGAHTDAHGNANQLLTPVIHLWLIIPGAILLLLGRLGPRLERLTRGYLGASVAAVCLALALSLAGYQDNVRWVLLSAGPLLGLTFAIFRAASTAHNDTP